MEGIAVRDTLISYNVQLNNRDAAQSPRTGIITLFLPRYLFQ
jgi:hypothetical protein